MASSKQVVTCCTRITKQFISKLLQYLNCLKVLVAVFTSVAFSGLAQAGAFATLLEMAHSNDPTYLSAKVAVESAEARTNQAFGQLLPQVSASLNSKFNDRDYHVRDGNNRTAKDQYNSNSAELNLTQPIWKYSNIISLRQAKSTTSQAEQQLANTEQELLSKVVSTWLDYLGARDQTLFTQQQIAVSNFKLQVAQRGFELGSISKPELDELKAKFDQANAENVTAETDLNLKGALLEQIVGSVNRLKPVFMRDDAKLFNLSSENFDSVLARAESESHNILAAMYAYEAATAEVKKQYAGHQPTLDLVASYGKNSQAVGGFPGQDGYDIKQGAIGLQLNVPIYSGGIQSAKVQEAIAQQEKARLDMEAAKRLAILTTKQAWYGWHSAYSKTLASEQAITAANSALLAAKVAVNSGLRSEVAVFEAKQQLSAAQRDNNRSRYDQVSNFIKLKSVIGVLTNEDIIALDTLFVDDYQTLEFKKSASLAKVNDYEK